MNVDKWAQMPQPLQFQILESFDVQTFRNLNFVSKRVNEIVKAYFTSILNSQSQETQKEFAKSNKLISSYTEMQFYFEKLEKLLPVVKIYNDVRWKGRLQNLYNAIVVKNEGCKASLQYFQININVKSDFDNSVPYLKYVYCQNKITKPDLLTIANNSKEYLPTIIVPNSYENSVRDCMLNFNIDINAICLKWITLNSQLTKEQLINKINKHVTT
ncbi:MAG: hypothetical protein JHC93_02140, partial [Parachlamydiales bacterium]|nr:hypothetical protein [Parachlamydiales bacterium]